jgi:ubiquinone biosynthesis UbiH/UbiF/VisC/COQ6 family hydroxylase
MPAASCRVAAMSDATLPASPAANAAPDVDVAIVGAGPAGLSLAAALADAGRSVTLVERQPRAALADPAPDGRDIALTHRGVAIMQRLGLWARLPADEIAPLREAQVTDGDSPFALRFDPGASGSAQLGFLVGNHAIRRAAFEAALARPGVSLVDGVAVADATVSPEHGRITLADGRSLRARLVVAADSRLSETRRRLGIGARMLDFGRTVIVCRMTHERAHGGVARECFRYGDTLAVLPLNGDASSIVVTVPSDRAPELLRAAPGAFAELIGERLRGALGAMRLAGERHAYPLVAVYAHRFVARRFALVGDAAVGMHPVTAHGFNFGLYGVDALVRAIGGGDPGSAAALAAYESEHRRATLPIYLGTNAVVKLFTDDRAPARALRGAVLRAAGALAPVRHAVERQLTGTLRPSRLLP